MCNLKSDNEMNTQALTIQFKKQNNINLKSYETFFSCVRLPAIFQTWKTVLHIVM